MTQPPVLNTPEGLLSDLLAQCHPLALPCPACFRPAWSGAAPDATLPGMTSPSAQASDAVFEQMRGSLERWAPLSAPEWAALRSIFTLQTLEARASLFHPGSRRHELLYVVSGLLRFYYLDSEGKESNKAFLAEGEFGGSLAAAALDLPLIYGVEALEPSQVLTAPIADFEALFDLHPVFDRLGRRFAELLLVRKELRTRSFLQQGARERYQDFLEQHPALVGRVAQYHIASFLGITEVSLSRLKRELGH